MKSQGSCPRPRHQNEIRKQFLRRFPLSRFLAKTLSVKIKLPWKVSQKICCSESTFKLGPLVLQYLPLARFTRPCRVDFKDNFLCTPAHVTSDTVIDVIILLFKHFSPSIFATNRWRVSYVLAVLISKIIFLTRLLMSLVALWSTLSFCSSRALVLQYLPLTADAFHTSSPCWFQR